MVVLPTGVWQTPPDGDRYISRVSSRCWASLSGGRGRKRGAIRWHWQMETYASLVTMRSCECGANAVLSTHQWLVAKDPGAGDIGPTSAIAYPSHRSRFFSSFEPSQTHSESSSLSSTAFTGQFKRQEAFRQRIVQFLSAISNRERVFMRRNALWNGASDVQSAALRDSVSPYVGGLGSFRLGLAWGLG